MVMAGKGITVLPRHAWDARQTGVPKTESVVFRVRWHERSPLFYQPGDVPCKSWGRGSKPLLASLWTTG